ncbi:hypothetical protein LY90DRAFT_503329 [Neocallimastix californiae]|uniref:Retrotransposon gag domain-containing protein n=1 Tax=Neocallimastix californiae TaxID=1754190 RepID=A0A1Y2ENQ7_9FUNG|nr:hypothetical protein LY90DRAFT_503329 [Neocallimastix californiae]|eukprot:ORY72944.1 hypothetical protein LY90DRAFT_503329 [Neocallimastix californiae]
MEDSKSKADTANKNASSSSDATNKDDLTTNITTSLSAIAQAMETQTQLMRSLQPLLDSMRDLNEKLTGRNQCRRQFDYYEKFYASEKKRVEFIEAHLGSASEWYYIFMSEKQRENPDSELLLDELRKFHLTDLPDSLKLKRLKELKHKWGNASDFVTKFKLYATQLQIPEILQLELFEDRVHPLVKKKLLDLEPQRRTIDNYSSMLMTYDSERDRHLDFDPNKRKSNSADKEQRKKKKKFKSWKEHSSSRNDNNETYNKFKDNKSSMSQISNINHNKHIDTKNRMGPKNSKRDFQ